MLTERAFWENRCIHPPADDPVRSDAGHLGVKSGPRASPSWPSLRLMGHESAWTELGSSETPGDQAGATLQTAVSMLGEMGMEFWLAKAQSALTRRRCAP